MRTCFSVAMFLMIMSFPARGAEPDGGFPVEGFTPARTVNVANAAELAAALGDAKPGDLVLLADGDYASEALLVVNVNGTREAPVVIRAANRAKARLSGKAGIRVEDSEYVAIEGIEFAHEARTPAVTLDGCRRCRITRNIIHLKEIDDTRMEWLSVDGDRSLHNRVDHNLVEEKRNSGVMLELGGSGAARGFESTRHDVIDNNHFRNFYPGTQNGYETIRAGSSTYSHSASFTTIQDNLFENCDGEGEIVSIKTRQVWVRRNTFRNCRGMLTLRNTHQCVVESNWFFDNGSKDSAGIRIFGRGHEVFNNYMQGLKGAGIMIRTGDIEMRTQSRHEMEQANNGVFDAAQWGQYQRPENALVAFNTVIDCGIGIDIGDKREQYPLPPRNCRILNNLFQGNGELIRVVSEPENWTWSGNLNLAGGTAAAGGEEQMIRTAAGALAETGGWYPLVAGNVAVDAAEKAPATITDDIEGQPREGKPDVGADELSAARPERAPLTAKMVGPDSD